MRDQISKSRIEKLHPLVRSKFEAFINEAEALNPEYTFRIMQGLRTFEEQQKLYNQGRSEKGSIVTNAQAGQSYHNYGLAIDLCELDDKIVDWAFHMEILRPLCKKYEITWGGDFKSIKDKPHFEINFGKKWQELLKLHNERKFDSEGYVILK